MKNIRSFLLSLLLLSAWPLSLLGAERVGVALDVSGPVMLISELNGFQDESPLLRTHYLSEGDRVTVAQGGSVTLMHLVSFKRFVIQGPNEVSIKTEGFFPKTGVAKPLEKADQATTMLAALDKGRTLFKLPGVAIGVRDLNKKVGDVVLISPTDKEQILETHPEFSWHHRPEMTDYRLIIQDRDGVAVLDTPVTSTPFRLPDTVSLQAGGHYFWQIVADNQGKPAQSILWSFDMLTAEEQAVLQQWRPAPDAPISDQVLYALVLEKMGVAGAAKQQWQQLHKRDPSDPLFTKKAK